MMVPTPIKEIFRTLFQPFRLFWLKLAKRQEKAKTAFLRRGAVLLVPGAQDRLEIENGSPIDGFERGDSEPAIAFDLQDGHAVEADGVGAVTSGQEG